MISQMFQQPKKDKVAKNEEVSEDRNNAQPDQIPTMTVKLDDGRLTYYTPNEMTAWRVKTIFKKEPCTIEWLMRLDESSVLLDVGANMGLYTIFTGVTRGCSEIYAFEPESQNFALLTKNIALNGLEGQVKPFCVALSNEVAIDYLYLSNFEWDGATSCHSYGEKVGFDLKPRKSPFAQGCVSYSIDKIISQGKMSVPNFIKIDVDGFEHKVIEGAWNTLQDPQVKSLCVEINTQLPEHLALIDQLKTIDFYYDPLQVERVMRQEGAFEGCAEFIFDKLKPVKYTNYDVFSKHRPKYSNKNWSEDILSHVCKRIEEAELIMDPTPHIVVDNVFPDDYYKQIIDNFPDESTLEAIAEKGRTGGGYADRKVVLFNDEDFSKLDEKRLEFWLDLASWLYSDFFVSSSIDRFLPFCANRLSRFQKEGGDISLKNDALIVSDRSGYSIGPHTDMKQRLISFLFYVPENDSDSSLGTSFYRPFDPDFRCDGSKHYQSGGFERVKTVEYLPNRLLMFVRTEKSFHGVEAIEKDNVDRRLLISNLRLLDD